MKHEYAELFFFPLFRRDSIHMNSWITGTNSAVLFRCETGASHLHVWMRTHRMQPAKCCGFSSAPEHFCACSFSNFFAADHHNGAKKKRNPVRIQPSRKELTDDCRDTAKWSAASTGLKLIWSQGPNEFPPGRSKHFRAIGPWWSCGLHTCSSFCGKLGQMTAAGWAACITAVTHRTLHQRLLPTLLLPFFFCCRTFGHLPWLPSVARVVWLVVGWRPMHGAAEPSLSLDLWSQDCTLNFQEKGSRIRVGKLRATRRLHGGNEMVPFSRGLVYSKHGANYTNRVSWTMGKLFRKF